MRVLVDWRLFMADEKFFGTKDMKSCVSSVYMRWEIEEALMRELRGVVHRLKKTGWKELVEKNYIYIYIYNLHSSNSTDKMATEQKCIKRNINIERKKINNNNTGVYKNIYRRKTIKQLKQLSKLALNLYAETIL